MGRTPAERAAIIQLLAGYGADPSVVQAFTLSIDSPGVLRAIVVVTHEDGSRSKEEREYPFQID